MLHDYFTFAAGLLLIIYSLIILVLPPKFGNIFYGVRTIWTLKSNAIWAKGQRLFAIAIMLIGVIFSFLGSFKLPDQIPNNVMFLLLIALWTLSKYIIHKILSNKYTT